MSTKKMTVAQLTMLTAVNMLGSGIVLLPTKLAEVGGISIVSWLVTAVGAMSLAYVFAQCGMLSTKQGGMGGYSEYAFGRSGNHMANFTYGLSLVIANVAIAITAVGYIKVLFGLAPTPLQVGLMTIALLWVTTIANFWGPQITGRVGGITVWGVIIPVVLVSTLGWFWFDTSVYSQGWNPHHKTLFEAAGASVAITLWAFLGLESACANADAVENPQKNVPIAVLGGTIGAAVIYIVSTNVIAGIIPNMELASSNAPFGLVFAHMFNPMVGTVVSSLMVLACVGSLLGWQFTTSQVFKSAADAGYFMKVFSWVNNAGAPIKGMLILLLVQTAFALLTISPELTKQFDALVNLSVVINLIPYILSMAAIITIQLVADVPTKKRRFVNIIALIGVAYSYLALYSSGQQALLLGGVVVILELTVYGFVSGRFVRAEQKRQQEQDETEYKVTKTLKPVWEKN